MAADSAAIIAELREGCKVAGINTAPIKESGLPIVWVLGGPGSGKGTQCAKIVAQFNWAHISTGDLLREAASEPSKRGELLTTLMTSGALVPMETVLELLKEAMIKALEQKKKGFLIDGYPREQAQGIAFEKEITPCNMVLYFECSQATLKSRLLARAQSSGRADDNETTIEARIKVFLSNNEGILQYYAFKLSTINAERPVDEIYNEVKEIFSSFKTADGAEAIQA